MPTYMMLLLALAPTGRLPDLLLRWHHSRPTPRRGRRPASGPTRPLRRRLFSGDNIDQEVKHVAPRQSAGDIRPLQRTPLVLLSMDPSAHGELRDEDVAAFGEENGCFGGDHFNIGVGFHDFFYARQGQLVQFVVVGFGLEVVDGLLPVGG